MENMNETPNSQRFFILTPKTTLVPHRDHGLELFSPYWFFLIFGRGEFENNTFFYLNLNIQNSKTINSMKKLLSGVAAVLLMVSCNGKTEGSDNSVDSTSVNDSMSATIIEDSDKNPAVTDSATQEIVLVQDSTKTSTEIKDDKETKATKGTKEDKPSPNAKKIDKLLSKYMECVKFYRSESNAGAMGEDLFSIEQAAYKYDKQLKKLQDQMTPEQKEKYKKAKKMWQTFQLLYIINYKSNNYDELGNSKDFE